MQTRIAEETTIFCIFLSVKMYAQTETEEIHWQTISVKAKKSNGVYRLSGVNDKERHMFFKNRKILTQYMLNRVYEDSRYSGQYDRYVYYGWCERKDMMELKQAIIEKTDMEISRVSLRINRLVRKWNESKL